MRFRLMIYQMVVASRQWCMFGRFGIGKALAFVTMGIVLLLGALIGEGVKSATLTDCLEGKGDSTDNFISWQLEGDPWRSERVAIEISPDQKFVAMLEREEERWVSIWELKSDLRLGREVYTTQGKFFVQDIEWVGNHLLISVLDGVKTLQDAHEKAHWEYLRRHTRILIWDNLERTESEFLKGDYEFIFGHPSGRKVLMFHRRRIGEDIGHYRVSLYSVPEGKKLKEFRLKLGDDLQQGYFYFPGPLFWCPDGKHFWLIDYSDKPLKTEGSLAPVPVLRVIGLDGSNEVISGNFRQNWLIVRGFHFLVRECADGYDKARGAPFLSVYFPPAVLVEGKLCAVFMAGWNKLRRIGFFNERGLVKEVVLSRKEFEPLRQSMKRIGIEHAEIKALAPDGKRLVLQELKVEKGVIEFAVPHGEKRWVLVWDMEQKELKRVALIGWIDKVFGWVGGSNLLVELKGPMVKNKLGYLDRTWEYGILCIPN